MSFSEFIMEDVKPEGWRQLLQPHGAAGKNSTSLLRRSSSWRRPGERGYYEPPRGARPLSCIEGGRMDKWLQTLERLQSRRPQNQIPQFEDRTVSMPVLPNEMAGSNPLCPDVSSLRRRNQTPSVCPSVRESSSSSLESVHIKAALAAERAQFCALAPVRFGWLPIQRHVILNDISDNHHDNSRCQVRKNNRKGNGCQNRKFIFREHFQIKKRTFSDFSIAFIAFFNFNYLFIYCCYYYYYYTVSSTNIGTLGKYEQRQLWK